MPVYPGALESRFLNSTDRHPLGQALPQDAHREKSPQFTHGNHQTDCHLRGADMWTSSIVSIAFLLLLAGLAKAQDGFTLECPAGHTDIMKYFVMDQARRTKFMKGTPNSIYTEVFPDRYFAARGYWLWLKSATAHGFDVKVFDEEHVY